MTNNGIINLQLWQLLAAYIFVILLLIIVKVRNLGKEQEIILATSRMTIQLVSVGYLLSYIFRQDSYLFPLLIMGIMELFSINNIYQRVEAKINKELKRIIAFAMLGGTLIGAFYFILVVIGLQPWYDAQYFIPIIGMLIGNSMTGISLGVERLISGIKEEKDEIRARLMLGAPPRKAVKKVVNAAFNTAILPTINSMMGMGIIFLPGMMTGQILSGVSPILAIEYQIAIMLGILGSVSLTVAIFIHVGYKTFFNERKQLNI